MTVAKAGKGDETVDYELNSDSASTGKGRPTPTRKEREAANLRPLVNNDRRAASKESRAKMAEVREKARIGMAAGEEKYLPVRDKGPQRRWIRDYVDARFSVGEVLIPVMFIVIILTFISNEIFQLIGIAGLWLFFLAAVIDGVILGMLVTRKLAQKFGADKVQSGSRWYAAMRAMQLRVMRLPKPQVKRGQFPV
ncbi:DUF3043 domain-containing protein [Terrimesophilobacter mesophilus]|uniref:DUF3043 domain-containing protein n=1 Tax=Terrimesophilobacter mesophilus TaxID=433647 RepID=A0A4V3I9B8_9MICO|nr:DUF3043 domain-containing protein [Terrimesophilobacter mesophilus]TFB78918.1 DUF3043 domain-containing protein [Terrimesophilobacter mesophilus]